MRRTPVYFLAHGGPSLIDMVNHPAYSKLQEIGHEITTEVKPTAMVVVSAHWQGGPSTIEVNTAESQGLIYDFYGFPSHYYDIDFPSKGSPTLADRIRKMLDTDGIKTKGVRRGFDHGVFIPFHIAFNPEDNPLDIPIVQISLFDNDNASSHYALGKALATLRDEGVVIVTSGMVVHNLRDFRKGLTSPKSLELAYTDPFDKAVKEATESDIKVRNAHMAALLKRPDARAAHPTFEHLLPLHVAAGAAGDDAGKQTWTLPEGSLSWAMYRFGDVGQVKSSIDKPAQEL